MKNLETKTLIGRGFADEHCTVKEIRINGELVAQIYDSWSTVMLYHNDKVVKTLSSVNNNCVAWCNIELYNDGISFTDCQGKEEFISFDSLPAIWEEQQKYAAQTFIFDEEEALKSLQISD